MKTTDFAGTALRHKEKALEREEARNIELRLEALQEEIKLGMAIYLVVRNENI